MNRAIKFILENKDNFIDGYNPGQDMASRLVRVALSSGTRSILVESSDEALVVSSEQEWLNMEAFEKMIPAPEISINSIRPEIVIRALSTCLVAKNAGKIYTFDARPSFDFSHQLERCGGSAILFVPPSPWLING